MKSDWSLDILFSEIHDDIQCKLNTARKALAHPVTKGEASENVWLGLLREYLPARYKAEKAFVVDSNGNFSEQIDVVIFDQQYSPFIFKFQEQIFVPAESVYAVFEAKQEINTNNIKYAQGKIKSVRNLHRTSLPIPYAGGIYPAKSLIHIMGGILSLESGWNPPMGSPLIEALSLDKGNGLLDIGCVAVHGIFQYGREAESYDFVTSGKSATAFIFELIARLQSCATVPMIDIRAYSTWLK